MSINKHTTLLTIAISIVSLVLIIIGVLVDYFCLCEHSLMGNLIAIFGGIFASAMVVLLCEIQKYVMNKNLSENRLFEDATLIFSQLVVMQAEIDKYIKDHTVQIVPSALTNPCNIINGTLRRVLACDYNTFCNRKSVLFQALNKFRQSANQFDTILNESCMYYELALNTAVLIHKQNGEPGVAYGGDIYIQKVAKITFNRIEELKNMCENLMTGIDYSNKFEWQQNRKKVNLTDVESIKTLNLDEYIDKYDS